MGEIQDGRCEVDVAHRPLDLRHPLRPVPVALRHPDHQWEVQRLLIGENLAATDAVLTEEHAVVGDEHENRPGQLTRSLDRAVDLGDVAVEASERGDSAAPVFAELALGCSLQLRQFARNRGLSLRSASSNDTGLGSPLVVNRDSSRGSGIGAWSQDRMDRSADRRGARAHRAADRRGAAAGRRC